MGHNISDRKRLAATLDSPLAAWRDWMLHVDCGAAGCARGRAYTVADLVGFYPGLTVNECLNRLRCGICRGAVTTAALQRQRRGREVEVVALQGRGSA